MNAQSPIDRPATLAIQYLPLRELEPFARNSRKHTARQIAKLRTSLARFGWTNPMLIADRTMIAGHARLTAAIQMAEAHQAIARNPDAWTGPTIDLSHLSTEERRAYVIADNRLALDAGWDTDLLNLEMGDLQLAGFDLSLTGFSNVEVSTLLGSERRAGRSLSDGLAYQIVLDCRDEEHQAQLLTKLRNEGLACKPLIL